MNYYELSQLSILKLINRFSKIQKDEYYLAYSGGKDSHLLYWFIKNILKDDQVKIVGLNTYREHTEILKRIQQNSDIVLHPALKMSEIINKYGVPCFSKGQDEIIDRYQKGNRTEYTLGRIHGTNTTKFALNKTARTMLLNDKLPKISNKCCYYTKKLPFYNYEKQTNRKSIIGVRGSESLMRKQAYQSCLSKTGSFTPLFDFTNDMIESIYITYKIEIPSVYKYINRTGCIGCPYAHKSGNLEKELNIITKGQYKYAMQSFQKSYDLINVDYNIDHIQLKFI